MATKKKKFKLDSDIARVLFIFLGSVFSTLVLVLAILGITSIQAGDLNVATKYIMGIFIVLSVSRLFIFIKERTKIALIRFLTLLAFNIVLAILILFAKNNPYFFALVGGLYCLTIVISRIFKMIQDHSPRSIVINSILITAATLLAVGLFIPDQVNPIANPVIILCTIVALSAFVEVVSGATTNLKLKVLLKIIVRTYALEIILGLVTMMVGFSLIIMIYEPDINSFGDALYHSFATVTTIGFGDFKVVTVVGRVLTVIMGIYGIIVVAVITSIIVNFYNETAGKKDKGEFKEIDGENKDKK